jgi:hypothetical protein
VGAGVVEQPDDRLIAQVRESFAAAGVENLLGVLVPDHRNQLFRCPNQYALEQLRPRPVDEDCAEYERLATAGNQRRRSAQRQWRRLLHALVAYSQLGDDERNRVAWTQLVTIWQVNGRLLRGGQACACRKFRPCWSGGVQRFWARVARVAPVGHPDRA